MGQDDSDVYVDRRSLRARFCGKDPAALGCKVDGSAQTQDDFIRDLFVWSVTGGRTLAIFFGLLILLSVFGVDTVIRAKLTESAEMKRLADEKSRWQERALGTELSHTSKEP